MAAKADEQKVTFDTEGGEVVPHYQCPLVPQLLYPDRKLGNIRTFTPPHQNDD